MDSLSLARRRLLRELKELTDAPLDFMSASPLEDDIFTWHCNITAPFLEGVCWHMELKFSEKYPADPPTATLFTRFPHPNVLSTPGGHFTICTDMLENGTLAGLSVAEQKEVEGTGWTPAYSVQSVLIQLQSFLLDEKAIAKQNITGGVMDMYKRQAKDFNCSRCPHKGTKIFPPLKLSLETLLGEEEVIQVFKSAEEDAELFQSLSSGSSDDDEEIMASSTYASPRGDKEEEEQLEDAVLAPLASSPMDEKEEHTSLSTPVSVCIPAKRKKKKKAKGATRATANPHAGWNQVKPKRQRNSPNKSAKPKSFGKNAHHQNTLSSPSSDSSNPFQLLLNSKQVWEVEHSKSTKNANKNNKNNNKKKATKQPMAYPYAAAASSFHSDYSESKNTTKASLPTATVGKKKKKPCTIAQKPTTWTPVFNIMEPSFSSSGNSPSSSQPAFDMSFSTPTQPSQGGSQSTQKKRRKKRRRKKKKKAPPVPQISSSSSSSSLAVPVKPSVPSLTSTLPAVSSGPATPQCAPQATNSSKPAKSPVSKASWALASKKKKNTSTVANKTVVPKRGGKGKEKGLEGWQAEFAEFLKTHHTALKLRERQQLSESAEASGDLHEWFDPFCPALEDSPFFGVPLEVLMVILRHLAPTSLASLSSVCKSMASAASDGFLWKELFQPYMGVKAERLVRHTPPGTQEKQQSEEQLVSARNWKGLFTRELKAIAEDLHCFYTRNSFKEDVLGIPIEYTVNPHKLTVDYISSSLCLISSEAYFDRKLRKGIWKESFELWLPLYISKDHFKRALPYIRQTVAKLANAGTAKGRRTAKFHPEQILQVFPKMLNTLVVLLMDKGISASMHVLNGYCAIHRLFIALVKEFRLERKVNDQVKRFLENTREQVKSRTASLGEWITLLSVCEHVSWTDKGVALCFLSETFDRNVLWACREYPELASLSKEQDKNPVDTERLEKTWKANQVSMRLTMFHVAFLTRVARKPPHTLNSVAKVYDSYFGRPPHQMQKEILGCVKEILDVKSWPAFFKLVRMRCPNRLQMTNWLRQSVRNSLKKKYHTHSTNFARVHASGMSKILRKGESYRVAKSLKKVTMKLGWGFYDNVKFLDAHCIPYSFDGKRLPYVDFSTTRAFDGALVHSGDIVNYQEKTAHHTINVDLGRIPAKVASLYFVVSAYTTTLQGVTLPWVKLLEGSDINAELCQYTIEKAGSTTAVIMCRMVRRTDSGGGWKVEALGHTCEGRASNYPPLFSAIAKIMTTPGRS